MRLSVYLLLLIFTTLSIDEIKAHSLVLDDNTGLTAASAPHIPEPMVFDMIRPLGAKKGELEINVLGLKSLSRRNRYFTLAPEIEFTPFNGFGLEFELPFHDVDLEEYKLGLQGTLSKSLDKKYIHGWQTLFRLDSDFKDFHWDLLHISAYKVAERASLVSMIGLRQDFLDVGYQLNPLMNLSYFRTSQKNFRIGLEANYEINDMGGADYRHNFLLMPQAHVELGKYLSLQVGSGIERYNEGFNPVFGTRLVLEL